MTTILIIGAAVWLVLGGLLALVLGWAAGRSCPPPEAAAPESVQADPSRLEAEPLPPEPVPAEASNSEMKIPGLVPY
jgi:hypothetical protein